MIDIIRINTPEAVYEIPIKVGKYELETIYFDTPINIPPQVCYIDTHTEEHKCLDIQYFEGAGWTAEEIIDTIERLLYGGM